MRKTAGRRPRTKRETMAASTAAARLGEEAIEVGQRIDEHVVGEGLARESRGSDGRTSA